jgi:hypothetical protein
MSPFGSRSNSIDSYHEDTPDNNISIHIPKMKKAWVSIKRRQRDKTIDESLSLSPSPSPERFLLKMKKMYDG